MNITHLLQTYQELSGEQANQINNYVAQALLHVVHSHIMTVTPSLVLTLCCRENHTCTFYNQVMSLLFRNWGIFPLQIVNVDQALEQSERRHVPGRRHYNLIFIDSYESFAKIEVESYSRDYDYNEPYYIFLQARDHLLLDEMHRIFEHCWRYQLINCNVQVQLASGDIQLYTYQPFRPHSCLNVTPQLINHYNGSHMVHPLLFPRKLLNLFGCKLRVAQPQLPAFLGDVELEHRLLHTLADRLNFSFELLPLQDNNTSSYNSAMNLLRRHEADLCLGGLYQTVERRSLATSTHNYLELSLRFAVLDVNYALSSVDILLYPYPENIWLAIGAVLGLGALVQLLMERLLPSNRICAHWLNLQLIFVGMPMLTPQLPCSSAKRMLCIVLMIFTLIIRNVYQGMLYHLIRTHQLKQLPQSIEDIYDENYIVVLSPEMLEMFSEIDRQLEDRVLDDDNSSILGYLEVNARNERLTTVAAPSVFMKYNHQRNLNHLKFPNGRNQIENYFVIIPENVMDVQLAIYFCKHSYLIDEFNEQIMWMRSAGLMSFWLRSEHGDASYKRPDQLLHSHRMFGLQELHVIFLFLLIGLLLSTILFGLELISLRFTKLQQWL